MTAIEMPKVTECSVSGCSYNHDGCTAFAVTVDADHDCATFIPLDTKGGLSKVISQVGACQQTDCVFNKDLECSAGSVRMGPGAGAAAECLSFQQA
ncbi:DUF1540 domain-containing protein [Brachybacterium sp. NPDC056505]|uniref:DUF1540 domain-containing protein n=1 Tax=Brachybacterium sp. NPDC056505 TaxID=3345843 RepID=UPI00366BCD0E